MFYVLLLTAQLNLLHPSAFIMTLQTCGRTARMITPCVGAIAYMQEVAKICNITAMPTFQVWKNKACVDTLVGANLDKLVGLVGKHAA